MRFLFSAAIIGFSVLGNISVCFAQEAPRAPRVDMSAIKPGETYRWRGSYLENKGNCSFVIGGESWGPENHTAPTGERKRRVNSRQQYTADCVDGNIKLSLFDTPEGGLAATKSDASKKDAPAAKSEVAKTGAPKLIKGTRTRPVQRDSLNIEI